MAMYGYALRDKQGREKIAGLNSSEVFFMVFAQSEELLEFHDTRESAAEALQEAGERGLPAITMDSSGQKLEHTDAVHGHGMMHTLIQGAQRAIMERAEAKGDEVG